MSLPSIFVDNIRLTVPSLSSKFHSFKARHKKRGWVNLPAKQTLLSRKTVVPPLHTVCRGGKNRRSLQQFPNQLFCKYISFSEQNFCKKNSELS